MTRWAWAGAFVIALGFASPPTRTGHSSRPKKPLGALKSDLRNIQRRKAQIRHQLRVTQHESATVKTDLRQIEGQLDDLESRYADTLDRLQVSRIEQHNAQSSLTETTKQLEATREQVERRLGMLYRQPTPTIVSVFIGAKSVGDVATRKYLMDRIVAQDHQLFTHFRTLRVQRQIAKDRCDKLVAEVNGLEHRQRAQKVDLADVRSRKATYLGQLKSRQGELQELLDQFEQDERTIQSQIDAYSQRSGARLPRFTGRLVKPINARLTSHFGMRYHPILHVYRLHAGVDFGAPVGTPIHCAADGVVIAAQTMRGYGNVVIIDHGGGVSTVYAHCSRIYVASGQHVRRGERIAAVGSTGLSTGPHLHFEVRVHGKPVDPLGWL